MPGDMTTNAFTIDVEDWHHCILHDPAQWCKYEDRIVYSTTKLLDIVEEKGVRATCFVLGYVAALHPELVEEIHERGHEVATHGCNHQFVYNQTPQGFRADLERSIRTIAEITGQRPLGYRAPFFSITSQSLWAYEVLADMGFEYDSSVYPVLNHRYGIPSAPRFAHRVQTNGDTSLLELPITTIRVWGINLPVGGGVYFRAVPYRIFRLAWRHVLREGQPAVFYVHPWEIDPDQPVMENIHPLFKARRYLNLHKAERKLRALLSDFKFAPVRDAFGHRLLPAHSQGGARQ
jgi:polysaccharide deacetylase family protein (PEP-CTERM system associated)